MIEGSCLCGGVRFQVTSEPFWSHQCHCSRCRKSTGSAFSAPLIVELGAVEFLEGKDLVTTYPHPGTSYVTSFCRVCGSATPLPEPAEGQPVSAVPLGTLDTDPTQPPVAHIYVASKAPWHTITDELPQFDELPAPEVQADLLARARARDD